MPPVALHVASDATLVLDLYAPEPAGDGNVCQGSPWIKQDALGDLGDIAVDEKIQRKVSSNECSQPPLSRNIG